MSLVEGNALLHGFAPTIRTLYAKATRLQVGLGWTDSKGWRFHGRADPPEPAALAQIARASTIQGRVTFEDTLAVIGTPERSTRRAKLVIRSYDDIEELNETYQRRQAETGSPEGSIAASESSDDQRLSQYLRNVEDQFVTRAPTLSLLFMEKDWETGWEEGWFLECSVPRIAFDAFAADVAAGRTRAASLQIDLHPMLSSDQYAPPSVKVTVGVLARGATASGAGVSGYLDGLFWKVRPVEGPRPRSRRARSRRVQAPVRSLASEQGDGSLTTRDRERVASLEAATLGLSRVVTRGFLAILLLLVALAILR